MSKEQIVADALQAISAGQSQVLSDAIGKAVDQSAVEQKASDGTLSQADLDKAVADALAAQKVVDDKALADAKAAADAAMADIQKQLSDMSAKEQAEEGVISSLQGSLQKAQDAIAAVVALFPKPVQP